MVWRRILSVFLGGVSFWTLTTALEMLTRRELNLAVGTFVPLGSLLLVYGLVRRKLRLRRAGLWMLAGVFLFGPLYCMAGATALGGGFAQGTTWENIRLLAVATVFPPVALVLAGYNITLFGVLLATLLVPIVEWQVNKREYKTTRPAAER